MKHLLFTFLFCLLSFSAHGWKVVQKNKGLSQEWELKITPRNKATGKDAEMWQNIDTLITIIRPFCEFSQEEYERIVHEKNREEPLPPYPFGPDHFIKKLLECRFYFIPPQSCQFGEEDEHPNVVGTNAFLRAKGFKKGMALPEGFWEALSKLTFLRMIVIKNFTVEQLPPSIGNLRGLYSLNLENINLQHPFLPDEIGNLKHLEWLDCNGCNLEALPASITNLTKLTRLRLWCNNLQDDLPEGMEKLQALRVLELNFNLFTKVPDFVLSLPNIFLFSILAKKDGPDFEFPSDAFFEHMRGQGQMVSLPFKQEDYYHLIHPGEK